MRYAIAAVIVGLSFLAGCRPAAEIMPAPERTSEPLRTERAVVARAEAPQRTVRGTVTAVDGDSVTIVGASGTRTARLSRTSRRARHGRAPSDVTIASEVRARLSLSDEWESLERIK